MGRNKIPSDKKKLRGYPGKRDESEEYEIDSPSLRCPIGLSKLEKKYWKKWAASLVVVGKLTILTVPSFLTLVKMKARLDTVNKFLDEENTSLLQENIFIDGAGKEHKVYKESAYAKMSRDLTTAVHRLEKSWGLTADSMAGLFKKKPEKSAAERFLE